jgi:hypothetical protein
LETAIAAKNNNRMLDVSELTKGIYTLKLKNDSGQSWQKLFVKR